MSLKWGLNGLYHLLRQLFSWSNTLKDASGPRLSILSHPPSHSSLLTLYSPGTLVSGRLSLPEDLHGSGSKETPVTYSEEWLISYNCNRVGRRRACLHSTYS